MPSEYLHKYNTDNVHARAVIVGLVNLLNSKIHFDNIYSDTDVKQVTVPFYYNFGGDERFLQDYFLQWNDCITPQMVDGNIDPIPRGIVTLSSSTINTNMLTNRFVRGNYVKQIGNEVLTYNAFLNPIPLSMNFEVVITADTSLDAFKIQQAILETFYKTQVFSVEFRGFRVPCQVGFPEDQGIEKTFEFTYQSDTEIKFSAPLQLETYYPVTDPTTERFGGNRMNYPPGGPNIEWSSDETYSKPRLTITAPAHGETYFSSSIMNIEWSNTGPITRVNLYYRKAGATEWIPIVKNLPNSGAYAWDLPFFDAAGIKARGSSLSVFVDTQSGERAKLRGIIDENGFVSEIIVLDGGQAYQGTDAIQVADTGVPTLPPTISPDVVGGTIIGTHIYAVGAGFFPTPINEFEIKLENSNNESIYTELSRTISFKADMAETIDVLYNMVPDISIPENLANLGLEVGQRVQAAGVPPGTTILTIDQDNNQIQISNPSGYTSTSQLITGSTIVGTITIK